eukprot:c29954_g1_i1 orf=31-231(+)
MMAHVMKFVGLCVKSCRGCREWLGVMPTHMLGGTQLTVGAGKQLGMPFQFGHRAILARSDGHEQLS